MCVERERAHECVCFLAQRRLCFRPGPGKEAMADREAVVVLGARLMPDGSCTALLAARVGRGVAVYNAISAGAADANRGNDAQAAPDFICTGYNNGGPCTEAKAMGLHAERLGVPRAAIILEEDARNTVENATRIVPIVARRSITSLHVVSSDFHIERVRAIFEAVLRKMQVKLEFYPARSGYSSHRLQDKLAEERLKTEYFIRNEAPTLERYSGPSREEPRLGVAEGD